MTLAHRLTRAQRRALLTLQVALSVGWLGASMVMLTLAIAPEPASPVTTRAPAEAAAERSNA